MKFQDSNPTLGCRVDSLNSITTRVYAKMTQNNTTKKEKNKNGTKFHDSNSTLACVVDGLSGLTTRGMLNDPKKTTQQKMKKVRKWDSHNERKIACYLGIGW